MQRLSFIICSILFLTVFLPLQRPVLAQDFEVSLECTRKNAEVFNTLGFNDLKRLSQPGNPDTILQAKVDIVLNTPIIDNSISVNNDKVLQDPYLGKFIRVASWNINRGMSFERIKTLFKNPFKLFAETNLKNPEKAELLRAEAEILRASSIIVLNEVDIGMPRTQYKNVVEELAQSIGYNYAFGTEFLEVDPAYLSMEKSKWSEVTHLYPDGDYLVDASKYKGLHGNAILSQYPIINARIIRLPSYYDWFNAERDKVSELEKVRRSISKNIFVENILREIRVGSRIALIADIKIPDYDVPVTVVSVHLENRVEPKYRQKQMVALLSELKDVKNPLILAGDLNTTLVDGSPMTFKKEIMKKIKNPKFFARNFIVYSLPYNYIATPAVKLASVARKYEDPTVKSIPIISPNPEKGLFKAIAHFKFNDGYTFDFRGNEERVVGKSGALANSNERDLKGFVPTFIFKRPLIIGKYKLDWIFVKSFSKDHKDDNEPFKFAPHFGMTMFDLNYAFESPLSDHAPVKVDLPLEDPPKKI